MSKDGLAMAPAGITKAPTMYEEIETIEDVARGHVLVTELIVYVFDKVVDVIDELSGIPTGAKKTLEKGRKPCFCQTKEQELIFAKNNPGVRIESFTVQLLKSTAIKYLNDPENMKQFKEKENG